MRQASRPWQIISIDYVGPLPRSRKGYQHLLANPVERVNRTINSAIRTYVREDQRLWDTKLPEIEMIINTSKHTSTGFTPYFITHGSELSESGNDHRLSRHDETPSEEEREKEPHESSTKHYNLRSRRFSKSFSVGQLVYRKNMKPSSAAENYNSKYGPQYLPCKVKAKVGSSSYDLEDLAGKALGIWPAINLKPG
ncbi:uncharacterized protein LOC134288395 [Aedes albopictus]|uniref:Integrase catalytic domain-containing protein n=1 Tax=Aedes albopictus TaxID=7160 RepID=A0ABM1YP49_AEDAL